MRRLGRPRSWSCALLLGAILCVPASALPGLTAPPGLDPPHAQVVDQAKEILLAQVVDRRPASSPQHGAAFTYSLRIVRVLKGGLGTRVHAPARGVLKVGATIEIDGELPRPDATLTYSDHKDSEFWREAHGRLGVDGDCSVESPNFFEEAKYLLLLGDPDDSKDLERIDSDDDRWLEFVARRVARRK